MKVASKVTRSVRSAMLAAIGFAAVLAHGETYTWTGAADGYWTNAANWMVDGVAAAVQPGIASNEVYFAEDGNLNEEGLAKRGDAVVFGAVGEGCATTINLDGFNSVGNITIADGAPVYTFGTAPG